jgi:hypothetical protein
MLLLLAAACAACEAGVPRGELHFYWQRFAVGWLGESGFCYVLQQQQQQQNQGVQAA